MFRVNASTGEKWAKRWCEHKQIAAWPWTGWEKRKLQGCEAPIRVKVKEQLDITLAKLGEHLPPTAKVVASLSMLSRELALPKLPRNKRRSMTGSGIRRGEAPVPAVCETV